MASDHAVRPLGVRILVAVGLLQGAILTAVGGLIVASYDDPELRQDLEATENVALTAGVVIIGIGLFQLILALGLRRGSHLIRSLYTLAAMVQIASSVYVMVALRDVRVAGIWSLGISIVALWFLYDSEQTEEFFSR